jgi:hypothetical protein
MIYIVRSFVFDILFLFYVVEAFPGIKEGSWMGQSDSTPGRQPQHWIYSFHFPSTGERCLEEWLFPSVAAVGLITPFAGILQGRNLASGIPSKT